VSGGTAPYAYQWQRLSGSEFIIASDPSDSATDFRWDGSLSSPPRVATWRCRVTDAASAVVYSPNVLVAMDPSA
jgi:hypothetical protein